MNSRPMTPKVWVGPGRVSLSFTEDGEMTPMVVTEMTPAAAEWLGETLVDMARRARLPRVEEAK